MSASIHDDDDRSWQQVVAALVDHYRELEADRARWRQRALEAEDRLDGQAWMDLEVERDRLRRERDAARAELAEVVRVLDRMEGDLSGLAATVTEVETLVAERREQA